MFVGDRVTDTGMHRKRKGSLSRFIRTVTKAWVIGIVVGILVLTSCTNSQIPTPQPTGSPNAATPSNTTPGLAPTETAASAVSQYKGTILIGMLSDYSGPLAKTCKEIAEGSLDYIRYINERKGGVRGYKLDVMNIDGKLDATLTQSGYKRLLDSLQPPSGARFISSIIASLFPFIRSGANTDKIVVMGASGSPSDLFLTRTDVESGKANFYFAYSPTFVERIKVEMEWAVKDWKSKGNSGTPKVAVWTLDDEQGHRIAKAGRKVAAQLGAEYVGETFITSNATDAVSQVTQLKQWGAHYVISAYDTDNTILLFARDSARIDYHPQFISHTVLATTANRTKEPALVNAMHYEYVVRWSETDVPEIALLRELNKEWHPGVEDRLSVYLDGWVKGKIFVEAIGQAIDQFGADKLTGDNVRLGFESIKNLDMNGLTGSVTYSARDHRGQTSLRLLRINEEFESVPVTGFITPTFTDEEMDPDYWE